MPGVHGNSNPYSEETIAAIWRLCGALNESALAAEAATRGMIRFARLHWRTMLAAIKPKVAEFWQRAELEATWPLWRWHLVFTWRRIVRKIRGPPSPQEFWS